MSRQNTTFSKLSKPGMDVLAILDLSMHLVGMDSPIGAQGKAQINGSL